MMDIIQVNYINLQNSNFKCVRITFSPHVNAPFFPEKLAADSLN